MISEPKLASPKGELLVSAKAPLNGQSSPRTNELKRVPEILRIGSNCNRSPFRYFPYGVGILAEVLSGTLLKLLPSNWRLLGFRRKTIRNGGFSTTCYFGKGVGAAGI